MNRRRRSPDPWHGPRVGDTEIVRFTRRMRREGVLSYRRGDVEVRFRDGDVQHGVGFRVDAVEKEDR